MCGTDSVCWNWSRCTRSSTFQRSKPITDEHHCWLVHVSVESSCVNFRRLSRVELATHGPCSRVMWTDVREHGPCGDGSFYERRVSFSIVIENVDKLAAHTLHTRGAVWNSSGSFFMRQWFDLNHDWITCVDLIWVKRFDWETFDLIWIWFEFLWFYLWFDQITSFSHLGQWVISYDDISWYTVSNHNH